jgi:hypothetical protein
MAGRAALGDPWIFSGRNVDRGEAARFLLDYAEALLATGTSGPGGAAGRVKQLLRFWRAGELVDRDRERWLGEPSPERLFGALASIAGNASRDSSPPAGGLGASAHGRGARAGARPFAAAASGARPASGHDAP